MAICGSVLGEKIGVMISWSYWVSLWCGNAVAATVVAEYGAGIIPGFEPSPFQAGLIGSGVLAVISLLNLGGLREAGRTQVILTTLKILPLFAVLLMLAGLILSPHGHFSGLPLAPMRVAGLNPAVTMAFFALVGFECAGMVAERVRDPAKNIVRATLLGMVGTALVYMALCTGIIAALPRAQLVASPAPLELFAGAMWGNWAAFSVAIFAAISGLGMMNAQTLLLGELPLGLVRAKQLPRFIAPTNGKDIAALPLIIGNGLAILLLLGSATAVGADLLAFLLKLTTAVSLWLYVGTCMAALRLRLAKIWAVIGTAFCLWVLYGAGLEAGGLAIGLMLAGLPLYWLALRFSPKPA
jgi:APA family basic amino acid/polyamine antiporter